MSEPLSIWNNCTLVVSLRLRQRARRFNTNKANTNQCFSATPKALVGWFHRLISFIELALSICAHSSMLLDSHLLYLSRLRHQSTWDQSKTRLYALTHSTRAYALHVRIGKMGKDSRSGLTKSAHSFYLL